MKDMMMIKSYEIITIMVEVGNFLIDKICTFRSLSFAAAYIITKPSIGFNPLPPAGEDGEPGLLPDDADPDPSDEPNELGPTPMIC